VKLIITKTDICECGCHKENNSVLHCIPCCSMCYEKYIDSQGNLNITKWGNVRRKVYEHSRYLGKDSVGDEVIVKEIDI